MSEAAKPNRVARSVALVLVFVLLAVGLPAFLRLIGAHDWLDGQGLGPDAFTYLYVGVGVILIVALTMGLRRLGPGGALGALGLSTFAVQGVVLMVLALAVLAFTASWLRHPFQFPGLGTALSLGLIGPFAEELLFRGFLFRQGRQWAGLPFWGSAILSSVLFGLGHLSQGETLGAALLAAAVTFVGGIVFCWVTERWGSLWPAIMLHAGMDFLWLSFLLGDNAIGGEIGNAARLAGLAVVILGTLVLTRGQKAA